MTGATTAFFVYGTLMRGQERELAWPRRPIRISKAFTTGELYDLGDYPAMSHGDYMIDGELWEFAPQDMATTITVLDRIEWYQQDDNDLYIREVVNVTANGLLVSAYCYFYAILADLTPSIQILPGQDGRCSWRR